jgi:dihydrofolate reductase
MRRLYVFNMLTLDGFFEGPNRDIGWHNVDAEFNEFAVEQLGTTDLLLFGRVTYELMASYWPTQAALKDDPIVALTMNSIAKIVFSTTLQKADWNNTRLVKQRIPEEVTKLKEQPGKDIAIFGSSDLATSLIPSNLIDEFRLIINPVVLGNGKTMFKGIRDVCNLKLLKTKTFHSGNVLLSYAQAKK